jgi:hypothetical protein
MPLIRCPTCTAPTPSVAVRCIHCGSLPPVCPDCTGSGSCPDCKTPAATVCFPDPNGRACERCGGTRSCPACGGRGRRWAAAAGSAG